MGSLTRAGALSARSLEPAVSVVSHQVKAGGRYDVSVAISTPAARLKAARGKVVELKIGKLARHVKTGKKGRATLHVTVVLKKGTLTIRASSANDTPRITVKLSPLHKTKPATRGATGSAGPTGPTGTPTAPAAPAASGTATVSLPAGFAPVASYTSLVKDYGFAGSVMPADWSVGDGTNYGYSSTEYEASQVSLTGSSVALTASRETAPNGMAYEGGWISTVNTYSFSHGMIDFRAQMPAGQGLWSGLWAINPAGTSPFTEIDVQEMLLGDTHTVNGSLHSWGPAPYWAQTQSTRETADLSAGFHDYQLIWQPGMVTWAVDGVAYAQYTEAQATNAGQAWPFDAPNGVYLIADLAVGGANDWGGAPNTATQFPATMQIQSIQVWQ